MTRTVLLLSVLAFGALTLSTASASAEPQPHRIVQPRLEGEPVPEADPREEPDKEREAKVHAPNGHAFARTLVAFGVGKLWGGPVRAAPGFRGLPDLDHLSPTIKLDLEAGFGARNLAFALELDYEAMLSGLPAPTGVDFQFFGVGVSGSYYFQHDLYLTAHLRYLWALLYRSDVPCFCDRFEGTGGPGVGLTIGKEWFHEWRRGAHERGGVGLAVDLAYARFGDDPKLHYASAALALTLTAF